MAFVAGMQGEGGFAGLGIHAEPRLQFGNCEAPVGAEGLQVHDAASSASLARQRASRLTASVSVRSLFAKQKRMCEVTSRAP